jgi:hypothetical protein
MRLHRYSSYIKGNGQDGGIAVFYWDSKLAVFNAVYVEPPIITSLCWKAAIHRLVLRIRGKMRRVLVSFFRDMAWPMMFQHYVCNGSRYCLARARGKVNDTYVVPSVGRDSNFWPMGRQTGVWDEFGVAAEV